MSTPSYRSMSPSMMRAVHERVEAGVLVYRQPSGRQVDRAGLKKWLITRIIIYSLIIIGCTALHIWTSGYDKLYIVGYCPLVTIVYLRFCLSNIYPFLDQHGIGRYDLSSRVRLHLDKGLESLFLSNTGRLREHQEELAAVREIVPKMVRAEMAAEVPALYVEEAAVP